MLCCYVFSDLLTCISIHAKSPVVQSFLTLFSSLYGFHNCVCYLFLLIISRRDMFCIFLTKIRREGLGSAIINQLKSCSACSGLSLAWVSIDTPAWVSTWSLVYSTISSAMSTSFTLEKASVRVSEEASIFAMVASI